MSRFHFQFENPSYVREKNFVSIKNTLDSSKHIYFIGIGGIGLSALARLYKESGKLVSGSDINKSMITDSLETLNIHIFSPQSISNIEQAIKYNGQIDCVIY
ncbi:MAG TPA: Mur ligase domain-containing protein, partial [Exilispira sp.]|nr:Mur ligase domain-containing protein [Exilispira sp.]